MGEAQQDIVSWKAHLLRSVNQEERKFLRQSHRRLFRATGCAVR